jgi:hypothetical protein
MTYRFLLGKCYVYICLVCVFFFFSRVIRGQKGKSNVKPINFQMIMV